ncbi:MAG: 2-C-methyl-D-erythritol 4-phosphate cytidylyltransferase [Firmicutes bacterium]|nr:2-C-methyl-D-erythritol 4-phosphate cytidylyltransferase [Bacillota bacterium]
MNIALILSGGVGTRIGSDIPKQYIEINNKPIIGYCIDTINRNDFIDKIVIVAEESWHKYISMYCKNVSKGIGLVKQGRNRQLSIFNGLEFVKTFADENDLIFIHDAARPMLSNELIDKCINTAYNNKCDGVLPVLPTKDTVYFSDDGQRITKLLDRKCIYAGQAPEVFRFGKYYDANIKLLPDKILSINGSSEPAVLASMNIMMVDGDENNFKITTQADLDKFKDLMKNESIGIT